MIERYSRPEMLAVWSQETKFQIWYEIETYACEAQANLGVIPRETVTAMLKAKDIHFDAGKINEIEKTTKHDVIAFLTYLSSFVGDYSRFIHQGMTSSDVLDTCFNIQLVRSCDLLVDGLERLLTVIKRRAFEYKNTICIGRSHGVHAEPITFGFKMAQAYAEMKRNLDRLKNAKKEICVGAISGAVGTFANIDPRVEEYVCKKLNLMPETISTQIIPRDRHAMFFSVLGIIASSIDRFATEIRHLQRTEILEVEEYFVEGQKGSSAMPHKRNPVLTENLSGLSRLVRMAVIPAMENVVLWHERDISHSSVERAIGPDCTTTLDFAISRLVNVIDNLVVNPKNMENNMNRFKGLIHSQRVLLALTQKGLSRDAAYGIVQKHAMNVWNSETDFLSELKTDLEIKKVLSDQELLENFDLAYHTKNIDFIFKRVFGRSST
jgi:adenylosuccinate lyase